MGIRDCAALPCRAGLLLVVSAFIALRPAYADNSTLIQGRCSVYLIWGTVSELRTAGNVS